MEKATACSSLNQIIGLEPCEVIEVNREHLWYRVRFEWGGTECYKLPEVTWKPFGGAGK